MNIVKIILGFVPLIVLSVLNDVVSIGWAALIGLVAALVVIGVTARGGIKILPVVQAVILLILAVLGFLGSSADDSFLGLYGRGLASLVLGLFIVATAGSMPFTAQFARAAVPRSMWHSPAFVALNRRLSLAWGAFVLILGVCHLVSAYLGAEHVHPVIRLLVEWVIPIIALVRVIGLTRRVASEHGGHEPGDPPNQAPSAPAEAG
jgi:intracellular septation protein A